MTIERGSPEIRSSNLKPNLQVATWAIAGCCWDAVTLWSHRLHYGQVAVGLLWLEWDTPFSHTPSSFFITIPVLQ